MGALRRPIGGGSPGSGPNAGDKLARNMFPNRRPRLGGGRKLGTRRPEAPRRGTLALPPRRAPLRPRCAAAASQTFCEQWTALFAAWSGHTCRRLQPPRPTRAAHPAPRVAPPRPLAPRPSGWPSPLFRRAASRGTLWRRAELERPSFVGASAGVDRQATQHLLARPFGPAPVQDGVWTEARAAAASCVPTGACRVCGEAPGSLRHIIWTRPRRADAHLRLTAAHPSLAEGADAVPPCLALASVVPCGLPPPLRAAITAMHAILLEGLACRADVLYPRASQTGRR